MPRKLPALVMAICVLAVSSLTLAHDAPTQLPAPQSAAEAWNVIEQSKANVDQLLAAHLTRDVAAQLANMSEALRALHNERDRQQTVQLTGELLTAEVDLLDASRDAHDAVSKTQPLWAEWCHTLASLEAEYPAATVHAEVYICPMHPGDRHLKPDEKCSLCGMSLIRRHLPASGVYQKPGEPTLKLSATCPQLVVGKPATVVIHLAKPDGGPVRPDDLIEAHTRKIHLLINDRTLSDYHHEHPEPREIPGDYQFSFTPRLPGPYRIWADVLPAASGVQEYVTVDLPAVTEPLPIPDRPTKLTALVDGRKYELAFNTAGGPVRAGRVVVGSISIIGADGSPFAQLQPVMGAFAHLVGFARDGKTVLHIHPYGKEPTSATDRAGPAFAFKFYSPVAGPMRLYCQVRIDDHDVFVPFDLTVLPDPATTQKP